MEYRWIIDRNHSKVSFKVKYLLISEITGYFKVFNSHLKSDEEDDFSNAKVDFTISVNSIDTASEQRDVHLVSPDFFDTEKYPTMQFQSISFLKIQANDYLLTGDLTIKGVTQLAKFNVTFNGSATDIAGNVKIAFEAHTTISRKDFGLSWNNVTEAGAVIVDDAIDIIMVLLFTREF